MRQSSVRSVYEAVRNFVVIQPIWVILVGILILASIVVPDFLSLSNFLDILLHSSVNGVMAVGMTFLMINGYFDLSVGTVMGFSAALTIGLQPFGMAVAILAALAARLVVGMINGFFVTKAKINAFVVTLASYIGMHGVLFVYTSERSIVGQDTVFATFGMSDVHGLPTLVLIMLATLSYRSICPAKISPRARYIRDWGECRGCAERRHRG